MVIIADGTRIHNAYAPGCLMIGVAPDQLTGPARRGLDRFALLQGKRVDCSGDLFNRFDVGYFYSAAVRLIFTAMEAASFIVKRVPPQAVSKSSAQTAVTISAEILFILKPPFKGRFSAVSRR